MATVTITVNPVNDPPIAVSDATYAVDEDIALIVSAPGVLGNDSDVDGDSLTASLATGPSDGTLGLNADGAFTYTPGPEFNGSDTFTYTASDGTVASNVATVTITVNAVNDTPTTSGIANVTDQEDALDRVIDLKTSFDDVEEGSAGLTYAVQANTNASIFDSTTIASGVLTLDYAANAFGTSDLTIRATDSGTLFVESTFTVTVTSVNDTPVAIDDTYSIDEDNSLGVASPGVLGNDGDTDGDPLTAVLGAGPGNGSLTLNGDGSFSYSPNPDFFGTDSFTYEANDGIAISNTATVTITVNPVNDAPFANDQSVVTAEDTPVATTLTASDLDGDPLTYNVVAGPADGTLSGTAPDLTYTPDPGFSGADQFTFQVNDGTVTSNTASITITVQSSGPRLEVGVVSNVANSSWATVQLPSSYNDMVVVCSPNYDSVQPPLVVRVRNATSGTTFEVRVQRADGSTTPISGVPVHYMAVEAGTYTQAEHGITMEAVKFSSTVTDNDSSWLGESRTYSNSYTSPVVLGQVMTENDARFSVFWSRGSSRINPPSNSTLWVGKTVCEDPDLTRADETIGYIVVESGSGTLDGTPYAAALGADLVLGMDDAHPTRTP